MRTLFNLDVCLHLSAESFQLFNPITDLDSKIEFTIRMKATSVCRQEISTSREPGNRETGCAKFSRDRDCVTVVVLGRISATTFTRRRWAREERSKSDQSFWRARPCARIDFPGSREWKLPVFKEAHYFSARNGRFYERPAGLSSSA